MPKKAPIKKKLKPAPVKKKRVPKRKGSKRVWFWRLFRGLIVLGLLFLLFLTLLTAFFLHDLPDVSEISGPSRHPSIRLLSVSGQMVASFGDVYGDYIPFDKIPLSTIQAVMATEDRRFFDHFGLDVLGILRAMVVNVQEGRVVQGGSTITQQLAKNIFLTPERSFKRKYQEMILAFWLEHKYSKEQILELYLNRVYLGAGNYGIDAAARSYFGKKGTQLNTQESAMLAGLLKAPSRYSPANDPQRAALRGRQVLQSMHDAGYISENMVTDISAKIEQKKRGGARSHYYFADWVFEQLPDLIGAPQEDITVVVTLDPRLQNLADEKLNEALEARGKELKVSQGAMVTIAPDGQILTMVGGRNYGQSQYNRVAQAKRQPGSAFKMFVYLTAFMNGFAPDDVMEDQPIQYGDWQPENYDGEYKGVTYLRDALAMSVNSIAVQLAQAVGIRKVVDLAHRMGIKSELDPFLSLALGTNEVTLLEIAGAYSVLSNSGVTVEPYGIVEIRTAKGDVLYQHEAPEKEEIITDDAIAKINATLMQVVQHGTGRKGRLLARDVAAKSGTSQDFRDGWFIGYTRQFTTAVWMGNDNNRPTNGVTGGGLPADAFREFMLAAHDGLPELKLPVDERYVPDTLPPLEPGEVQENRGSGRNFWDMIFYREESEEPAPIIQQPRHRDRPRWQDGNRPTEPTPRNDTPRHERAYPTSR